MHGQPLRSARGEDLDTHNSEISQPHSSHPSRFGPFRKSGCHVPAIPALGFGDVSPATWLPDKFTQKGMHGPTLDQSLANNLRVASGNPDKRLCCTRWRTTALLPLLQCALGNSQCCGEFCLGKTGTLACRQHLIRSHLGDACGLSRFHFSHGLQQLQAECLGSGWVSGRSAATHFQSPLGLP